MKALSELTKEDIKNIKLVCFDVDGVTIKKGTEMKNKIIELKKYFFVCINSGRSSLYLTKVFADLLWDNFALISEIGIFSLVAGELVQHEKFDQTTLTKMRNI